MREKSRNLPVTPNHSINVRYCMCMKLNYILKRNLCFHWLPNVLSVRLLTIVIENRVSFRLMTYICSILLHANRVCVVYIE